MPGSTSPRDAMMGALGHVPSRALGSAGAMKLAAGVGLGVALGTLMGPLMGAGPIAPALAASAGTIAAAPEPSPLPRRWQLDLRTSPLRTAIFTDATGRLRAYFFMTYTVTNNSNTDLLFAPLFELSTDGGDIVRAGRDVPLAIARQIQASVNNPEVQDQISIVGTLLRGEENAKDGLVIWAAPALHLSEIAVYAAGFSGETATVEVPNPVTNQVERKVLRKTKEMRYRVEGDMAAGSLTPLEPVEQRWIMR